MDDGCGSDDYLFMGQALEHARQAAAHGEVPVGALLVGKDGHVIASGGNSCIASCDPTGHAEIYVLRAAGQILANYRFPGTTMYVTLEPCAMCATAMVQARVARVVFGAFDPKTGGLESVYKIGTDGRLNHSFQVKGGVMEFECSVILKDFFRRRRKGMK